MTNQKRLELQADYATRVSNLNFSREYLHEYHLHWTRVFYWSDIVGAAIGGGAFFGMMYDTTVFGSIFVFILTAIGVIHKGLPHSEHLKKIDIVTGKQKENVQWAIREWKKLSNYTTEPDLQKRLNYLDKELSKKCNEADEHWQGTKINKNIKSLIHKAEISAKKFDNLEFPEYTAQSTKR
jgi:hypothetical protein